MQQFAKRSINFNVWKLNEDFNLMLQVMRDSWNAAGTSTIFDVEDVQGKDQNLVTQKFVSKASLMLTAAVAAGAKKRSPLKPLWDTSKFALGLWFSQTAYVVVREINGPQITVENQFGARMHFSRDILEKMESADHFKKEVPCTMTELAEVL